MKADAILPRAAWPGLVVTLIVGGITVGLGRSLPQVSPMLVAIILGVLLRNLTRLPDFLQPGIAYSAKRILRVGVVLLGLQVSFTTVASLGAGVLAIVVAAVGVTFLATVGLGRILGIDRELTLLIAGGFSICGAAAVAGVQGSVRSSEDKVAAAVALVVLYGTLMIPGAQLVIRLFHYDESQAAVSIGGSIHEVAQVVAAAGIAGGGMILASAVTVKLARVALLAPVVFAVSLTQRRAGSCDETARRPPVLPLFVVGFLLMMGVATTGWLPSGILASAKILQQLLLAAAMFALGLGVHIPSLLRLGPRPLLLGAVSTLVVITTVSVGVALIS